MTTFNLSLYYEMKFEQEELARGISGFKAWCQTLEGAEFRAFHERHTLNKKRGKRFQYYVKLCKDVSRDFWEDAIVKCNHDYFLAEKHCLDEGYAPPHFVHAIECTKCGITLGPMKMDKPVDSCPWCQI